MSKAAAFWLFSAVVLLPATSFAQVPAAPTPCGVSALDPFRVQIYWTDVPNQSEYKVFRNGLELAKVLGNATTYVDVPAPETYTYCVRALNYDGQSPPCCTDFTMPPPPTPVPPEACSATQNSSSSVTIQWTESPSAQSYFLYRDGILRGVFERGKTSFTDIPSYGLHEYCVRSRNSLGLSEPCCSWGARADGVLPIELSWEECEPRIVQRSWSAPGLLSLISSVSGLSQPVLGHDTTIEFGDDVPDAWRFDAEGCQTEDRFEPIVTEAVGSCPPLRGTNEYVISGCAYDPGTRRAMLRIVVTFDTFTPDPAQRYALWRLVFDHSRSRPDSDSNPNTCDDADRRMNFDVRGSAMLANGNFVLFWTPGTESRVGWGANSGSVATIPTTIGRVKALYR